MPEVVEALEGALVLTWTPPADDVVAIAADVAALLAAAHERGVAHGPLLRDHVRAGGVVDGWAGGDPADDVAAFGSLLLDAGGLPGAVAAVARRATADDRAARPTMAAVAAALRPPAPPGGAATAAPAPAAAVTPRPVPRRSRSRIRVPAWVPAAAAIPVALAALVVTGGDAKPAAVAVEVRCEQVETRASLDPDTGALRLDDGPVLTGVPPGCEVVVRP